MLSEEPDLTRELDEAEAIVTSRTEAVVTEWGTRYDHHGGKVGIFGAGPDNERRARQEAATWPDTGTLVRRTVTYGPWEASE